MKNVSENIDQKDLNQQTNGHGKQTKKPKKRGIIRGFGSIVLSPYKMLFSSLVDTKKTSEHFIKVVKETNKANNYKAQRAELMKDPVYSAAQKIKNDRERFIFMQKENGISKQEIKRRIKIKQQMQALFAALMIFGWILALNFLSKNINDFGFFNTAMMFMCMLGASLFTTETLKAALHKTQLQDRDLMDLKRFTNHPNFYSKLFNPLS